ncbi:MAG TPA: site-specific integrase [Symbiobacteriaceae bacterium]|jgi:integrase|nr:site-specific integrase [Symbiobacteriaceae bacterium]
MEFVQPIRERRQIEAMKRQLKGNEYGLRDVCLFTLGINSGLRVSDLLKLTVGHVVDAKGKPLDRITLREQKTGKAKSFPISATAARAITEYLAARPGADSGDPLFLSRKSKGPGHLQRAQAYKIINDAARAVGITEAIGTHTLRKTFGYWAYKEGKDITLIQKLLNHASPSITLAYIGITQDQLDDVYLSLNL